MFCSKCGKTLKPDAQQCEYCFEPVGESRFEGIQYTSAQRRIAPGYRPNAGGVAGDEAGGQFDDARTSYRARAGSTLTSEEKRGMRYAVETGRVDEPERVTAADDVMEKARAKLEKIDDSLQMEAIDRSQFEIKPIESHGRAGISEDVSEYIRMLEENAEKGVSRRAIRSDKKKEAPAVDLPEDGADVYDDTASREDDGDIGDELDDYPDEDDAAEDEGHAYGLPRVAPRKLIGIAAAFVAVAVLFVVGFMLFRGGKEAPSASMAGVTESLYTDGLAAIRANASDASVKRLVDIGKTEGLPALTAQLKLDSAAVEALLPATPGENDALFVQAMTYIQKNISSAIIMDASMSTDTAESAQRWDVVNNSIAALAAARTPEDLNLILSGVVISTASLPTPAPSPTPVVYTTLAKGDKTEGVLTMQSRLYELGYYTDDRDGSFGPNTQTAVKLFQEAAGLTVNGIADNETLTLLYSDAAPAAGGATPAPTLDASGT